MTRMLSNRALYIALISKNPIIEKQGEFQIKLDEKYVASVQYEETEVVDLMHSEVPKDLQGMGLGSKLAERIFDHLASKKKKFTITCEFLQKVYDEKFKTKYRDIYLDKSKDNRK